MFLEECEYIINEKKTPKYIIDDIEISSDSDRTNSNVENSNKKNSAVEHFDEENSKNTNITHILKLIFEDYR